MKYTGRIFTVIIFLVVDSMYIIYCLNKLGHLDKLQITTFPILVLVSWYVGWTYDKSRLYFQKLNKCNEDLQQIFDNIDAALWSYDVGKNSLVVSAGFEKIYGVSREMFLHKPEVWQKVVHPEDIELVKECNRKLYLGEPSYVIYRIVKDNDEIRWVKDQGRPTFDSSGKLVKINGVIFDITEQKIIEEKYKEIEESNMRRLDYSPIGIVIHQKGKFLYINPIGAKTLNIDNPEKMINKSIFNIIHSESYKVSNSRLKKLEDKEIAASSEEIKLVRSDGSTIDMEVTSVNITYLGEPVVMAMGIDITDRKKAEEEIRNLAYYDNLTGLPNRNMLNKYFNEMMNNSKTKGQKTGVMFIDLDRFKMINDTMGHAFGDAVLQKFSERLVESVEKDGMVSRYGGDEFIILLNDTNQMEAERLAQRIIDKFSHPLIINKHKIFSTPSIGISVSEEDENHLETLIKYADIAMFFAKEKGKNNYQFYTSNQSENVSKKMYIENQLRRALENNEFVLYYQPQFNLNTGKIVGVEALVRWQHPKYGMISPAEFIPVAEETGLIIPIGDWVLKTACKQNKAWQEAGICSVYVAVNISAYQFQHKNFVKTINQVLKETKLDPQYLELEITESIMQNVKQLNGVLNELKSIGVRLSLDDFGTGYSSLNVLRYSPIDTLKIDKSFIDDVIDDLNTAPIVKTIIDMGNNLRLNVIAEGIENKGQVEFLKKNKCELGQGYFLSLPLSAEEINKVLLEDSMVCLYD